jgi:hypothetical protein
MDKAGVMSVAFIEELFIELQEPCEVSHVDGSFIRMNMILLLQ